MGETTSANRRAAPPFGIGRFADPSPRGHGRGRTVFTATDRRSGGLRIVTLSAWREPPDDAVERFGATQTRLSAWNGHPTLAAPLAWGTSHGRAWVASAAAPGVLLSERLATGGPFAAAPLLRMGVLLGEALAAVHEVDALCGDLGPCDVWLDDGGGVHLHGAGMTDVVESVASSDVRDLGSILYQLATGRPPLADPLPALRAAGAPPALVDVLVATLAADPTDRPPSAAALAGAIHDVERRLGLAPVPAVPRPAAPSSAVPPEPRRRRGVVVGTAAALLALAAGLALLVAGRHDDAGEAVPSVTAVTSGPSYVHVSDDSGVLALRVPASWAERDGAPTTLGPNLVAAPDVATFDESYDVPGVSMQATRQLDARRLDARMDELEGALGGDCTAATRTTYSDARYAGYQQRFSCGRGDLVLVLVAPQDAAYAVQLVVQVVEDGDEAALQSVLDSFAVDGERLP